MMKANQILFTKTCNFNAADESYSIVSSVYHANLHERINYRGTYPVYHILNNNTTKHRTQSTASRYENYLIRCQENNVKPYLKN